MSEEDIPSLEKINEAKEKVEKLLRHINNVQEACYLLGKKLIERGEIELGIKLIAAGQVHDNSKWKGAEFDYLIDPPPNSNGLLSAIVKHHQHTNLHHIEYWKENEMPRLYVGEMVADWLARANEQGSDIWKWVNEDAVPRYNIIKNGNVYKWIKEFLDLLLEKPFSKIDND